MYLCYHVCSPLDCQPRTNSILAGAWVRDDIPFHALFDTNPNQARLSAKGISLMLGEMPAKEDLKKGGKVKKSYVGVGRS